MEGHDPFGLSSGHARDDSLARLHIEVMIENRSNAMNVTRIHITRNIHVIRGIITNDAYCLSPIAYCLLPFAYCLSPIAHRPLPIAYFLFAIALLVASQHCSILPHLQAIRLLQF